MEHLTNMEQEIIEGSVVEKRCILHIGNGSTNGEIRLFVDNLDKWDKVKLTKERRELALKSSKYDELMINLPEVFEGNDGYHSICYKNFTAFSYKKENSTQDPLPSTKSLTRSKTQKIETTSTGCLPALCIFCNKGRKKTKGTWENLGKNSSINAEITIRETASAIDDTEMLMKIGNHRFGDGPDFVALEINYHHTCRKAYINQKRNLHSAHNTQKSIRNIKEEAFSYIKDILQVDIIDRKSAIYLSDLLDKYKLKFRSLSGDIKDIESYNVQNFSRKIKEELGESELTIVANSTRKSIISQKDISLEDMYKIAKERNEKESSCDLWKCALHLRKEILNTPSKPLSEPLTVQNIIEGEADIPDDVKTFFNIMYTGDSSGKDVSEKKKRLIDSSSADAVFACSGGKKVPRKQLSLGLAVKSMTGSRRVVTVLNKLGHCSSNETVRRVEMGMESTISENNSIVPNHIKEKPDLITGLAWDNFDINMETPSGADSIHHTYGICYQLIKDEENDNNVDISFTVESDIEKQKVTKFKKVNKSQTLDNIEPYRKKPKKSNFEFQNRELEKPDSYEEAKILDILWLLITNFSKKDIPMWTGWNSLLENSDCHTKQRICYMKHIELPPTRLDVVRETLRRSQEVSKKCGQKHTIVTYDLGIAKVAKQIQSEESPEFDNIFVMFGAFHILLNVFSSTGKIIEGSGGPYVLSEANIVAPGSINRFLKGKMYNRCKRGNTLLATAIHGLHMEKFIDELTEKDMILAELEQIAEREPVSLDFIENNVDLSKSLEKYEVFVDQTLKGERGKTAQYWMQYVKIIDLAMVLQRSIKNNDPVLFSYALFELTPIFFMTNHVNYARWMVLYSLELANLDIEVAEMLKSSGFSVNRSGKFFSEVPVDMALEQTINADAKNRLTGIMKYADVSTAVNRWTVTHSMKTQLINSLLEMCGMNDSSSLHKETKPPRIRKDNFDLKQLKDIIRSSLNPFDESINNDFLFNIKTGRKVTIEAENYLLKIFQEGSKKRDEFVSNCIEDPSRFEKSLKKTKIVNFSTQHIKRLNKSKTVSDLIDAKGTRDLFGRLLYLSVTNDIAIEKIFEFPILPQPPCFCHPDDSMYQSDKSKVFHHLTEGHDCTPPEHFNAVIVDGMFLLRSMANQHFLTFAAFARVLIVKALKLTAQRVDLCFDVYESPSIKDAKRYDRGNDDTEREFTFGPRQKFPSDFNSLMKISEFKKELLKFLFREYEDPIYAHLIGDKVVYCSVDNVCKKYHSRDGLLISENVTDLYGQHLEADTRVAFHALHIDSIKEEDILIRANDTDVLIILLTNITKFRSSIFLDFGLDHNNSRKIINITELSRTLDIDVLPGVYALTGNDYVPSFHGKGKVRPMVLMNKNATFMAAFRRLGEDDLDEEVYNALEEFVCHMYGFKKEKNIQKAIQIHLKLKCQPSKASGKPLDSLKSVDPKSFPPCRAVLREQIKRAWFISNLYKNATQPYPCNEYSELDFGWQLSEDRKFLDLKWFIGNQVPPEIESIEKSSMSDDEDVENETDDSDEEEEDFED